jgi:hypothetical protein
MGPGRDRDGAEAAAPDEVQVAADDQVRCAIARELEKLVAPRKAAGSQPGQDRHRLDEPAEEAAALPALLDRRIGIELRVGERAREFRHAVLGCEQPTLVDGPPHRLARH